MKGQLEKEVLTSSQRKKSLDEILSQQKVRPRNQGLGFNPRNTTKSVNPPTKVDFVREGHKVVGNGKKVAIGGGATRGKPNNSFAGKNNPSYVLCKGKDGNVFAKYVGPRDGYAYRWYSIWVPKSLVTNAKGPITQWVPKLKT